MSSAATLMPSKRSVVAAGSSFGVLMRGLIAVGLLAPIAVYVWIALHRIGYPFEIDWMEGGSVELAARVAGGHSLYTAPSLAFVGWTYPPLYYWLAAVVAKVTGVGFLPLRLVSLVASLVSMATLAAIVVRETGERVAGLVAAGLFAATFQISGSWFDTGRVDSMFLALTLLAVAWGRRARGMRGGVALGLLAFLAFFTKQTALLALLPVLVYLAFARTRVGVPALLTLLGLALASTVVLDGLTHGWYRYYVFDELAQQPWAKQVWVSFWVDDVLHKQWPVLILVITGGLSLMFRGRARVRLDWRSPSVYYAAATVGLVASAWASRLHTGGYTNVLMPAYAAFALLAGLVCGQLFRDRRRAAVIGALVAVILLAQLALLAYPPDSQIPTAADRAVGAQLMSRLRALPGPVIVFRHPWYATLAGKGVSYAQEEAVHEVLRSAATRGARALRASLRVSLDALHVQAVVLDYSSDGSLLEPEFSREFRLQRRPITAIPLYPLTDLRSAPALVYLRVGRQSHRQP